MVIAAYVAQAPDIAIRDGVVAIRGKTEGEDLCFHMPLREFRIGMVRAQKVLDEHDAAGHVVRLERRGR